MKTFLKVIPFAVLVIVLVVVRFGADIFKAAPASPTTTAATTAATSATTTAPSPTPIVTTTTETHAPVTNNEKLEWYFNRPDPLNQELPSSIPASISELIAKYNTLWQAPPTAQKTVYLTMDMGYEYNENTTKILDTAKLKGVPITFFIVGDYLNSRPELVIRMLEEGHLVGNHTADHINLVDVIGESGEATMMADIHELETNFKTITGEDMAKIFRAPSGTYSEQVLDALSRNGYKTYFWSFAYQDWLVDDQPNPADAKAKILGQLHNGSIILLHAVSNTNTNLLPELIDEIRAMGYEFARVDEIP